MWMYWSRQISRARILIGYPQSKRNVVVRRVCGGIIRILCLSQNSTWMSLVVIPVLLHSGEWDRLLH